MAHDKVFGICENKCLVPVAPKTETDAIKEKLDAIKVNNGVIEGEFSGTVNGVTIKTGVYTVTPKTGGAFYSVHDYLMILSIKPGVTYTGSINFKNTWTGGSQNLKYWTQAEKATLSIPKNSTTSLTFTNISYLSIANDTPAGIQVQEFTLT